MRDVHSHILPGVDDGAQNLDESLAMLKAAKANGVSSIVCTPHCRDPFYDHDAMMRSYELLCKHADGFSLRMGFEVYHAKLLDLGIERADKLCFDGGNEFLLELSPHAGKHEYKTYERTIYELQSKGYTVIIAHPERYHAIQQDIEIAHELVNMGCKLQVSADFIVGGRLGTSKKPAKKLFEKKLVSYIASDAHSTEHYDYIAKARSTYRPLGAHARLGMASGLLE